MSMLMTNDEFHHFWIVRQKNTMWGCLVFASDVAKTLFDSEPNSAKKPMRRCKTCAGCTAIVDCGTCKNCIDKAKFGGRGRRKQSCTYRRCITIRGPYAVTTENTILAKAVTQ